MNEMNYTSPGWWTYIAAFEACCPPRARYNINAVFTDFKTGFKTAHTFENPKFDGKDWYHPDTDQPLTSPWQVTHFMVMEGEIPPEDPTHQERILRSIYPLDGIMPPRW